MPATLAGLAVAGLLVVSMIGGSSALSLLASAVALVASVLSPLTGLIALASMAPIPRPLVIPPPGLYVAIGGAIMLGMIVRLPIERPRLGAPAPQILLLLAFTVYAAANFVGQPLDGSVSPRADEIAGLFSQLVSGVLAFIVASIVLRGRSPYPVLVALIVSAVFVSTLGVSQAIGAEGFFGNLIGPSGAGPRITGPNGDPNYFGSYLAVASTLALACAALVRSTRLKLVLISVAAYVAITLVLTQSRGALLAIIAGIATIGFTRSRRLGLATVVAALLIGSIGYPLLSEMRFGQDAANAQLSLSAEEDSSGRIAAWLSSGELVMESPLIGIGFGRFKEESSVGIEAHNWYASVLGELGVVGFVLWALFVSSLVLALRRGSLSARTVGYSVLASFLVANMFLELPTAYQVTGATFVALAAACAADWSGERTRSEPLAASSLPLGARRRGGLRAWPRHSRRVA